MVTKLLFQRKIEKVYFCLKITFNVVCTPLRKYHLLVNTPLIINFLYNELKSLASILIGCEVLKFQSAKTDS